MHSVNFIKSVVQKIPKIPKKLTRCFKKEEEPSSHHSATFSSRTSGGGPQVHPPVSIPIHQLDTSSVISDSDLMRELEELDRESHEELEKHDAVKAIKKGDVKFFEESSLFFNESWVGGEFIDQTIEVKNLKIAVFFYETTITKIVDALKEKKLDALEKNLKMLKHFFESFSKKVNLKKEDLDSSEAFKQSIFNFLSILKRFLNSKFDTHAKIAIEKNDEAFLKILLENCCVSHIDPSLLKSVCQKDHLNLIKLLFQKSSKRSEYDALAIAVETGRLDILQCLVEEFPEKKLTLEVRYPDGRTLLGIAINEAHEDIVTYLLSKHSNHNLLSKEIFLLTLTSSDAIFEAVLKFSEPEEKKTLLTFAVQETLKQAQQTDSAENTPLFLNHQESTFSKAVLQQAFDTLSKNEAQPLRKTAIAHFLIEQGLDFQETVLEAAKKGDLALLKFCQGLKPLEKEALEKSFLSVYENSTLSLEAKKEIAHFLIEQGLDFQETVLEELKKGNLALLKFCQEIKPLEKEALEKSFLMVCTNSALSLEAKKEIAHFLIEQGLDFQETVLEAAKKGDLALLKFCQGLKPDEVQVAFKEYFNSLSLTFEKEGSFDLSRLIDSFIENRKEMSVESKKTICTFLIQKAADLKRLEEAATSSLDVDIMRLLSEFQRIRPDYWRDEFLKLADNILYAHPPFYEKLSNFVKFLIEKEVDIRAVFLKGREKNFTLLKACLDNKPDIFTPEFLTTQLIDVVSDKRVFNLLISKGAQIGQFILNLVRNNDLKTLELVFDFSPDEALEKGLVLAKELKHKEMVKFLEKELPDRNEIYEALYKYAVTGKKEDILTRVTPTQRQCLAECKEGRLTLLQKAFIFKQAEAAEYLIEHGKDISQLGNVRKDNIRRWSMFLKILKSKLSIPDAKEFLKEHKINLIAFDGDYEFNFDYVEAIRSVQNLVDQQDYSDALWSFSTKKIYDNVLEAIKYLAEQGANLHVIDKNGNTFLHLICGNQGQRFKEVLDYFNSKNVNFKIQNLKGQNLLHIAVTSAGTLENIKSKIEYLCQNFPSLMLQQDVNGKTSLDLARESYADDVSLKYLFPHHEALSNYKAIRWANITVTGLQQEWRGKEKILLDFLFEDLCKDEIDDKKKTVMWGLSKVDPFKEHFKEMFPRYVSRLSNHFFVNNVDGDLLECPITMQQINRQQGIESHQKLVYLIPNHTAFLFTTEEFRQFCERRIYAGRFNPDSDLIQLRWDTEHWIKTN